MSKLNHDDKSNLSGTLMNSWFNELILESHVILCVLIVLKS